MRKITKPTITRHRQLIQSDFTIYTALLASQCEVIPKFAKLHVQRWLAKWAALVKQLH